MASNIQNIEFERKNGLYEAIVEVTGPFNLYIEKAEDTPVYMVVRKTSFRSGKWNVIKEAK